MTVASSDEVFAVRNQIKGSLSREDEDGFVSMTAEFLLRIDALIDALASAQPEIKGPAEHQWKYHAGAVYDEKYCAVCGLEYDEGDLRTAKPCSGRTAPAPSVAEPTKDDLTRDHAPYPERNEPAQCCMCGKDGLSTIEGDGGDECQLEDGRWTCSADCYYRATMTSIDRDELVRDLRACISVKTHLPRSHSELMQRAVDVLAAPLLYPPVAEGMVLVRRKLTPEMDTLLVRAGSLNTIYDTQNVWDKLLALATPNQADGAGETNHDRS